MVDQKKYYGFYIARVVEVDIPEFKDYGAVRVSIPDLMLEEIGIDNNDSSMDLESNGLIAFPGNNYLGGRDTKTKFKDHYYQGSVLIPPPGSLVWIWFLGGDIDRVFYGNAANEMYAKLPPEQTTSENPHLVYTLLKTHQGRTIVLSDDVKNQRVEITGKKRLLSGDDPAGNADSTYTIVGNQTTILLDEREGKEQLTISTYKGDYLRIDITNRKLHMYFQNDINIKTDGNFSIEATKKIHIKSNDSMFLETNKQMNIKAKCGIGVTGGGNMHLCSTGGTVRIDGNRVYVNSGIQMQASSSAPIAPIGGRDI